MLQAVNFSFGEMFLNGTFYEWDEMNNAHVLLTQ